MKRYMNLTLLYAVLAMVGGVFYREFTKFNGFTDKTTLGVVPVSYTHLDGGEPARPDNDLGPEHRPANVHQLDDPEEAGPDEPDDTETVSYTHLDVYKRQGQRDGGHLQGEHQQRGHGGGVAAEQQRDQKQVTGLGENAQTEQEQHQPCLLYTSRCV